METLFQDLRFAFRTLLKTPLVTGAALLSLALGIGANTTIFTLVNAVLLRGPAVEDPETLVSVFTTEAGQRFGAFAPVSRPNYESLRDRAGVFSDLIDVIGTGAALQTGDGEPEQVGGLLVTGSYFETLGVEPRIGRGFLPEEDEVPGAAPVVVLSHDFWQQRFGGDRSLVGGTIRLNGEPFTVVGVAPPGFNGTNTLGGPSFWVPMMMYRTFLNETFLDWYESRRAGLTNVFGRLAPGVGADQAEAAVQTVGTALQSEFPDDNKGRNFTVVPLSQAAINPNARGGFVLAGAVMMAAVGLVLLIACANVANLLLGRAAARRREIGVRLAMGAPRARLVRQLLTESLLLALLAGGLGLLFAHWGRSALWAQRPPFLQQTTLDVSFDPRVLAFTLALTLATGLLFGLVPALRASRPEIVEDIRQGVDTSRGAMRLWSLRNVVVMVQVGLSFVALIGAGLLVRSLGEATRIDLGFETEGVATMNFNLASLGYDADRGEQFYDRVLERARAIPGVERASLATVLPFTGGIWRTVLVEGRPEEGEHNRILVPVNTVALDYFKTLGVELLAGRDFQATDHADAPAAAVVNEAMAELFWPEEEALGQRFHFYGQDVVREVVGVVRDTKYLAIGEAPQPQAYLPRRQGFEPAMTLVLRTGGDPETVMGTARRQLQELDRNLPITGVQTLATLVEQSLWNARMGAALLSVFGLLALVLAAVGIYGVMAYSVRQRNREIGIRIALGAGRDDVLRMVLVQGMKVVAVGLGIGLALALVSARHVGDLLYGTSPTDAVTFGTTLLVLGLIAAIANLLPAWRATGVNPTQVLRFER